MAQGRANKGGGGDSRAVIGAGTRVRGRIHGDGDLTVHGEVEGDIVLRGDLEVSDGAKVTSNVEARSVSIAGSLEGDVAASGPVHIGAGARVRGDVRGEQVQIDEGAQFAGRLDCEFELPSELSGSGGGRKRS